MAIRPGVDEMIDFLNELLTRDQEFMRRLIHTTFPCNELVSNHPTVQVWSKEELQERQRKDGNEPNEWSATDRAAFLGVVNGFFGVFDDGERKGWGAIAVTTDEPSGNILRFSRTENKGGSE